MANWYFWAVDNATFPADEEKDKDIRNATNVIRLITRLMFVWFLKEKGLISDKLFDEKYLKTILKFKNNSAYYKAILQNLFFATLNSEMAKREFATEEKFQGKSKHYGVYNVFRYKQEFFTPDETRKNLFEPIPFLNGGLFECLDKETEVDGTKCRVRVDGFSDHPKNVLEIPDELFFGSERQIELNEIYGTKNKKYKVRGLINILNSYKFTITENTPIEEEIALDPELLGKVFENLLANFNPETKTTARKQTGSFYTPREIVNYMVDESLLAYLKAKLQTETEGFGAKGENRYLQKPARSKGADDESEERPYSVRASATEDESLETALRNLFSYTEDKHEFNETETEILIKAIDNCKILDPACGSGAFPMGILHRLVHLLGKLDKANEKWREWQRLKAIKDTEEAYKIGDHQEREDRLLEINDVFENNASDYGRKLFLIENCIYGVDIQPIAIQIAKLRFFISLIVDQKPNAETRTSVSVSSENALTDVQASANKARASANNLGIRPLPNLETKFVAANTLIGLETNGGLKPNGVTELEKQLKEVRAKHFGARTRKTKEKYRTEDKKIRSQIADLLKQGGINETSADLITEWNPYDQNASAKWFDAEWMFGIEKGFDIIIGNPPYIKEYTFREAFDGVRNSPYYQGKMDIWYLFACNGIDSLKHKSGILTLIATNNWTTNSGASKMRNKIIKDSKLEKLLDFGSSMIFESADIQTMIMIFRNDNITDNYCFDYRRLNGGGLNFQSILDLLSHKNTDYTEFLKPKISKKQYLDSFITFSAKNLDKILNQIQLKRNFSLSEYNEVAQGMVFPQDNLNKKNQKILGDDFYVGQGIFIISEVEKNFLNLSDKESEITKPYYTTNQLSKWFGNPENQEWVIYTDSSFRYPVNLKPYSNIKKHLDQFQAVITSDNKPYGLHRARNEYFFQGEKIIALRKCAYEPVFTYTDFDCYVSATFYVIKSERINQKYLTALLNSELVAFWLRNKGKMQGNNYQIDKEPLLQIPIFKPSENQQTEIAEIVDEIIEAKKHDTNANTSKLECKIDELVYQLYGLTDEEIRIVEGK